MEELRKKKQEKFEEFYKKFLRKCLSEDILPVPVLKYEVNGIFPGLDFTVVEEETKKQIISSLDEKK